MTEQEVNSILAEYDGCEPIRQEADDYQHLFNHMSERYGLILTIQEMDEIILHAENIMYRFNNNKPLTTQTPPDVSGEEKV